MQFSEFLEKMSSKNIMKIGEFSEYKTIGAYYQGSIEHSLPSKDVIQDWHELLKQYVSEDDAIVFIRRYGSYKNYDLLRRGFLSIDERGFGYIYCDNYLAQYFYHLAIEGIVPTLDEFKKSIQDKEFPFGRRDTEEEKRFRAYNNKHKSNINQKGWKLAHIYNVNKDYPDYNDLNYQEYSKTIFPVGEATDWDNPEKIRKVKSISEEEKKFFIAHFFRLVHPINYFLVPKPDYENDDYGSNIGELPQLIEFMKKVIHDRYPEIIEEFKEYAKVIETNVSPSIHDDFVINLTFGTRVKKEKVQMKNAITSEVTEAIKEKEKVGVYVRKNISVMIENELFDDEMVSQLCNRDYCKQTFGITNSLLLKVDVDPAKDLKEQVEYLREQAKDHRQNIRYIITKTYEILDKQYIISKELYESNRANFERWFKEFEIE
ncbi:Uncharacterised protein [Turicibacter sanguinis]|nr:Uncharacterised protein [Turicibacter sanguinis]